MIRIISALYLCLLNRNTAGKHDKLIFANFTRKRTIFLLVSKGPLVGLAAIDRQIRRVCPLVAAVLQRASVECGALAVRLVAHVPIPLIADFYVRQRPLPRLAVARLFVEVVE